MNGKVTCDNGSVDINFRHPIDNCLWGSTRVSKHRINGGCSGGSCHFLPLMCTPRLWVVEWTDTPDDLNGLVRFAERRNLVSAHVPSHFERSLFILGASWNRVVNATPRSLYHRKELQYQPYGRLGVLQGPSGRVWRREISCLHRGLNTETFSS
jgi:hypothetical protein